MHVTSCKTICNACRSKKLAQILNKMGFYMSYKEFEKIHIRLAARVIVAAKFQLATVPQVDLGLLLLLEAVNYYHKELHLGFCSSPRSASEYLR